MKNIQLLGWGLVVVGSFLPLVKIPIIGSWNYWDADHTLAIICWAISALALVGILFNKTKMVRVSALLLLVLFGFTLGAIKFKSSDYFRFIPFNGLKELAAGTIKFGWGWLVEFLGTLILLFSKNKSS